MPVTPTVPDHINLTDLPALDQAAECLRTLAHPHRLRIVQMLLQGKFTVGELAAACGIPSHMASEHLRLMMRCGLLAFEKDGRKAFYHVAEPHLAQILSCIEARFGVAPPTAPAAPEASAPTPLPPTEAPSAPTPPAAENPETFSSP